MPKALDPWDHWTARRALPRCIGRTEGGLNSKLHAVCDGFGGPLILLLTEGQMSDFGGAALMLDALPKAKRLLGDKPVLSFAKGGYDADWFHYALIERGITPRIPPKSNRKLRAVFAISPASQHPTRRCGAMSSSPTKMLCLRCSSVSARI